MASVWQRLGEIVGSVSDRTGVVGSLLNVFDPDNWLPGGKDAAFTLALIALSAKMAVSDGVVIVLEGDEVRQVRVSTGIVGSTWIEITDGVEEGDLVVLADLEAEVATGDAEQTGPGSRFDGGGISGGLGGGGGFSGGPPSGGMMPR